ncbi:hypothetical protein D1007_26813 [Hordeum vulgare]|nr:hypothetical protein D1007_26813 [Hordeum vulgare]
MHAKEVRHRMEKLTPEQHRNPAYAADSPVWEAWFAWEHEEQRLHGVRDVVDGPSPPHIVREEDHEVEAVVPERAGGRPAGERGGTVSQGGLGGEGGVLLEAAGGGHGALRRR